ncbi:MAG: TRAP transporter small permease [Pseudomonadales bacterium]
MIVRLQRLLHGIENALLVGLLVALVGVAAYQVLARNFFDGGLLWGDALVRVLVFWITMVGSMVAARADEHIRIDLLARLLGPFGKRLARAGASLFAALICALLAYASFEFIRYEYEDGTLAFGSVPVWICQTVLPIGASVMGLRYLLRVFTP